MNRIISGATANKVFKAFQDVKAKHGHEMSLEIRNAHFQKDPQAPFFDDKAEVSFRTSVASLDDSSSDLQFTLISKESDGVRYRDARLSFSIAHDSYNGYSAFTDNSDVIADIMLALM